MRRSTNVSLTIINRSTSCWSYRSSILYGLVIGVLTNGIVLGIVLAIWLSSPMLQSKQTVIIRNGSYNFFLQFLLSILILLEIPIGTIVLFSGNLSALNDSAHIWLYCNGSEVSRIVYKNLFQVIGEMYGTGNGNNTFNLPDFRFRFPLGSDGSENGSLPTGGSKFKTLTAAQMPVHNHNEGTLQTLGSGTHSHTISDPGHNHGGYTDSAPYSSGSGGMNPSSGSGDDSISHQHRIFNGTTNISILSSGSHTHTINGFTGTNGGSQPFDIMPPYQTIHYIIRA